MRTCLNCKHKNERINISPCHKCIETESYINWKSELPRIIALWIQMTLICGIGIFGAWLFLNMAEHDSWWAGLKCGLAGTLLIGGSLMALEYLMKREERRQNG
jgi:hypothetical protein